MIGSITKIKRTLTEASLNVLSLVICQLLNYVIPVLLTPYLIKTIGIEKFGQLSILQMILFYMVMVVNYGFNLSGPIEIVKQKSLDNSVFFSDIINTKFLLMLCSSVLGLIIPICYGFTVSDSLYIFGSFFLYLLGIVFFPEWFFHGMQKLNYMVLFFIVWKALYCILILTFVKSPSDYLNVVFFDGIMIFVIGIISFVFVLFSFNMSYKISSLEAIKLKIKTDRYLFSSNILTILYTRGGFLLLGLSAPSISVANFAIAERYIFIVNGALSMVNRISIPYLSLFRVQKTDSQYKVYVKYLIYSCLVVGITLFVISFFLSDYISFWLSAGSNKDVSKLIKLLSISFITSSLCSFASSVLLIENLSSKVSHINIIGFVIGLVVVLPLIYLLDEYGLALGVVINSIVLALICCYYLKSYKLL